MLATAFGMLSSSSSFFSFHPPLVRPFLPLPVIDCTLSSSCFSRLQFFLLFINFYPLAYLLQVWTFPSWKRQLHCLLFPKSKTSYHGLQSVCYDKNNSLPLWPHLFRELPRIFQGAPPLWIQNGLFKIRDCYFKRSSRFWFHRVVDLFNKLWFYSKCSHRRSTIHENEIGSDNNNNPRLIITII